MQNHHHPHPKGIIRKGYYSNTNVNPWKLNQPKEHCLKFITSIRIHTSVKWESSHYSMEYSWIFPTFGLHVRMSKNISRNTSSSHITLLWIWIRFCYNVTLCYSNIQWVLYYTQPLVVLGASIPTYSCYSTYCPTF